MKTYVIADMHGRFDLLVEAISKIAHHSRGSAATLITLGDYVDRGPQSRQIIDLLMNWKSNHLRLVALKGNHETMMVETIRKPLEPGWWIGNGGGATLISYGHTPRGQYDPTCVPAAHLDWIDLRPMLHFDKHRVYVHAGVDETKALEDQTEQMMTWFLYPQGYAGGHGARHVVHGHEQFADGPKLFSGRTDLDTFAWLTGRMVVGVFEDELPGGPVELIEVIGERDRRAA